MFKVDVYDAKGVKKGNLSLQGDDTGMQLLAQAVHVYESHQHPHLALKKTRAFVRASGRKIYKQKGTGGARHGSVKAPIFVGGGIAHGPKNIKKYLRLPHAFHQKALTTALFLKARENQLVVVENIDSFKKTNDVQKVVDAVLSAREVKKYAGRITFGLATGNLTESKVFRNLRNSKTVLYRNLNAYDVVYGGLIILDKDALEEKDKKAAKSAAKVEKEVRPATKVKVIRKSTVKVVKKTKVKK